MADGHEGRTLQMAVSRGINSAARLSPRLCVKNPASRLLVVEGASAEELSQQTRGRDVTVGDGTDVVEEFL